MEIVQGFIAAGAAGTGAEGIASDSDFDVARSFLTESASGTWSPLADVVVYDNDAAASYRTRLLDAEPAETATPSASGTGASPEELDAADQVTVDVQVVAVGDVDGSGVYTPALTRAASEIAYSLVRVDGEWRIDELPVSLLMSEFAFSLVFEPVDLQFLAVDGATFVPDVRYVPERNAASHAVEHLLAGPVDWLAPAVTTQIPGELGVEGGRGVVMAEDGTAEVYLAQSSAASEQLDVMYAQVIRTLREIDIRKVELWLGAVPYEPSDGLVVEESVPTSGELIAVSDGVLMRVEGAEMTPYLPPVADPGGDTGPEGEGGEGEPSPTAEATPARDLRHPAPAYEGSAGVAALRGGDLVQITPEGVETVLWSAPNPIPPSQDRFGWIWTGDGEAVVAARGDSEPVALDLGQLGDGAIAQLRISPDGARAVALRYDVTGQWLQAMAVTRDEAGTPVGLVAGPRLMDVASGLDVAWVDSTTVALLAISEPGAAATVRTVPITGPASTFAASSSAVSLAAATGSNELYLATEDSRLLARVSLRWEEVASPVIDPAFAG